MASGAGGEASESGASAGVAESSSTAGLDFASSTGGVAASTEDGSSEAESSSESGEPVFVFDVASVFGVPNYDDDDDDDRSDWRQALFEGDNDVSSLVIPAVVDASEIRFRLEGEPEDLRELRVWNGDEIVVGNDGTEAYGTEGSVTASVEPTELAVVFGTWNVHATLAIDVVDASGAVLESDVIALRSSPLIVNHHLQPAEHAWVVQSSGFYGNNGAMRAVYANVLGDRYTDVPGNAYDGDVWIQDEFEFALSTGNGGQRLETVIDSIRNRGLDDFPEDALIGHDVIGATWGNPQQRTTYDSFGNLEASPPVTVNGVAYPFGRIYYGRQGNTGLHATLAAFLQSQRIQAPFEVDTLWLCVGHVDEFTSFVPDASSKRGWKFLIADVNAAYELLDALPPSTALPRYGADHGYDTIGALRSDNGLRNLNLDLQAGELDPIREQFERELGLDDSDIIAIPALFERVGGCGGRVAALIPGLVNLVVAAPAGSGTHVFLADPFLRTNAADQGSDPLVAAVTELLPPELQLHFVDNWDVYHVNLGEVHCGTNVRRSPVGEWWSVGLHLLEGDGAGSK